MKRILFSVMTVVLCVGMMGGAFAYFTDTDVTAANNIDAGTLELSVDDGASTYVDVGNAKPGDEFNVNIRLLNDGSVPIGVIMGNVVITKDVTPNRPEAGGFADVIKVTRLEDNIGDAGNDIDKFVIFGDEAEPVTLAEFAEGYRAGGTYGARSGATWMWSMMEEWGDTDVVSLAPGEGMRLWIDLEFMKGDDEGLPDGVGPQMNEYQEAELEFNLEFMALQVGAPMPDSLDSDSPAYWS